MEASLETLRHLHEFVVVTTAMVLYLNKLLIFTLAIDIEKKHPRRGA